MIDNLPSIRIPQNEETVDFSAKLLQFLSQEKPKSWGDAELTREFSTISIFTLFCRLRVCFYEELRSWPSIVCSWKFSYASFKNILKGSWMFLDCFLKSFCKVSYKVSYKFLQSFLYISANSRRLYRMITFAFIAFLMVDIMKLCFCLDSRYYSKNIE